PHAGLGNGSRKMGMSLLRLKRPVPFGSAEFDPVEFVCCLSAVDSDSHLKAFFDLVNLLRMEPFKQKLHDSETPEEVNEIIRRYESGIDRNRERS
ncbi:MAG TPA: PTS sugar transporter, partial [Ruminococcaceae bacterium]|nr:PTS sugar transporter [Oscillospiraceae bacterium]